MRKAFQDPEVGFLNLDRSGETLAARAKVCLGCVPSIKIPCRLSSDKRCSFRQETRRQSRHTPVESVNVIALLEGTDAELKNEYVILYGHEHSRLGSMARQAPSGAGLEVTPFLLPS